VTTTTSRGLLAIGDAATFGVFALSQSVLDHASVGMVVTTDDDQVIWANLAACNILRMPRRDLIDREFTSLFSPDDRTSLTADTTELLRGNPVPVFRRVPLQGGARWVCVGTSIAEDESGPALRRVAGTHACIIRQLLDISGQHSSEVEAAADIAQLRLRITELERSARALSAVAHKASHDLAEVSTSTSANRVRNTTRAFA
jgi:PAS domain S-box-containing protein